MRSILGEGVLAISGTTLMFATSSAASGDGTDFLSRFSDQGPWALLFVCLFIWVLREKREDQKVAIEREERLMKALEELSKAYSDLAGDVEDVKGDIKKILSRDGERR